MYIINYPAMPFNLPKANCLINLSREWFSEDALYSELVMLPNYTTMVGQCVPTSSYLEVCGHQSWIYMHPNVVCSVCIKSAPSLLCSCSLLFQLSTFLLQSSTGLAGKRVTANKLRLYPLPAKPLSYTCLALGTWLGLTLFHLQAGPLVWWASKWSWWSCHFHT